MAGIRRNDIVQVLTGDDKGKSGKVLRIDRVKDRILVEGVNFVWKHLRRSQKHPHGARIQKESSIHASNVVLLCQSCNKPTRVTWKRLQDKSRVRICRGCQQGVSPEA